MGVDVLEGTDSIGPDTGVGRTVVAFIVSSVGGEVVGDEVGWTGSGASCAVEAHEGKATKPKLTTNVNKSLTNILWIPLSF